MAVKLLEKEVQSGHFNYRHINPYLVTYHFGPLTRKITKNKQVFLVLPNTENLLSKLSGCHFEQGWCSVNHTIVFFSSLAVEKPGKIQYS